MRHKEWKMGTMVERFAQAEHKKTAQDLVRVSGSRTNAAQKDKAKATPSGHAVRVTHCSGQAQTTTTVANLTG